MPPCSHRPAVSNTYETCATVERSTPDARHAVRDADRGQPRATVECTKPDARHAVRNGNRGQARAFRECRIVNACHAVRDGDGGETLAAGERAMPDARHVVRNHQIFDLHIVQIQMLCVIQGIIISTTKGNLAPCREVGDMHSCQSRATGERATTDARHTIRDGDGGQPRATVERATTDALHAVSDRDGGKTLATVKRAIQEIPTGHRHFFQA